MVRAYFGGRIQRTAHKEIGNFTNSHYTDKNSSIGNLAVWHEALTFGYMLHNESRLLQSVSISL